MKVKIKNRFLKEVELIRRTAQDKKMFWLISPQNHNSLFCISLTESKHMEEGEFLFSFSQNTTHPRVCGLQYPPKVDISNQHNPQGWAYRWHCGSSAFRPDAISAPTTVPGNPSGSPRFRDT